jgi:2-dehydro-3-deoxygluconokinase
MTTPSLDVVTFGEVMAMFVAEEPGPLERVARFRRAMAGAETNVATGLARLGHRAGWIGRVGDDPFGRFALAELAASGVDTTAVTLDSDAPTGFQLKSRADGGDPEVVYFRRNSAGSRLAPSPATDAYVVTARHLHVTGIPLALSASARDFAFRAVDVARAAGATVSFDPNLRPTLWASPQEMVRVVNEMAARADWVLPGLAEGHLLTGRPDPEGVAAFYLEQGASCVVIKNGAHGASAHTAEGRVDQPVFPVQVVDTVGAGDGFAAGLISGYLDGLDLPSRLRRAAAVGALATTSPGDKDGLPTRAELDAVVGAVAVPVA